MRKFLTRRDRRRSLFGENKPEHFDSVGHVGPVVGPSVSPGPSDHIVPPSPIGAVPLHDRAGSVNGELQSVQEDAVSTYSTTAGSRRASLFTTDGDDGLAVGESTPTIKTVSTATAISVVPTLTTTGDDAGSTQDTFVEPSGTSGTPAAHRKGILHPFASMKSSSTTLYPHTRQQQEELQRKQTLNIQRLVKPDWDSSTRKMGWLNQVDENSRDAKKLRLCRGELRGSALYVFRAPQELAEIAYFTAEEQQEHGDDIHTKEGSSEHSDKSSPVTLPQLNGPSLEDLRNQAQEMGLVKPAHSPSLEPVSPTDTTSENAPPLADEIRNLSIVDGALDDTIFSSADLHASVLAQKSASADHRALAEPMQSNGSQSSFRRGPIVAGKIVYKSYVCPHPALKFEGQNGIILGGSVESVCHTICFYPSPDVAEKLVKILPMMADINVPLGYLKQYLELFVASTREGHESTASTSASSEKSDSTTTLEPVQIPEEAFRLMVSRISRCLQVIATLFAGMLLDDTIMRSLWSVLVLLDSVSDCSDLKMLIHERQRALRLLLHADPNTEPAGAMASLDADTFLHCSMENLACEINALDHRFLKVWNARKDRSLVVDKVHECFGYWRKNTLIFDAVDDIHYLGRLIAYHLFEDPRGCKDVAKRAHVLEKWVLLGELLYRKGNMVSWLGIATFVCSVPVLRLKDTWSRIDAQIVDFVRKSWAPIIFEVRQRKLKPHASAGVGMYRVLVPAGIGRDYAKEDVVPYYGEIHFAKGQDLPDNFVKVFCEFSQKADYSVAKWDEFYEGVRNQDGLVSSDASRGLCGKTDSDLSYRLRTVVHYAMSQKPFSLRDGMALSLDVEPPRAGQYYRYHNTSRSPLFLGSYASILFPKVLDTYEIYDRQSLLGAIGVKPKNAERAVDASANSNNNNNSLSTISRNTVLKHIRDVFSVDTFEFAEDDGTILFKSVADPMEPDDAKAANRVSKSRPSSVLFGENSSSRRVSSYSMSSFNLDDYVTPYRPKSPDTSGDGAESESRAESSRSNAEANTRRLLAQGERSISIFAEAATVERLIDLLVLTGSVFSPRIAEDDVKAFAEKMSANARSLILKMDESAYATTFFAVYRCFCSPLQLVLGLQKRFAGAKMCSVSLSSGESTPFPDWRASVPDELGDHVHWPTVAKIQLAVLDALVTLFEHHYGHLLDEVDTRDAIESLLETVSCELEVTWPEVTRTHPGDHAVEQLVGRLLQAYKNARSSYVKNCYTPLTDSLNVAFGAKVTQVPEGKQLPDFEDTQAVVHFVEEVDETIRGVMAEVSVEDWIEAFEILEVLTAKSPLALFNYDAQRASTSDRLLTISNIYHWISTLVDSDTTSSQSFAFVVDKFPASIRVVLQFYFRLKSYFSAQLVDPYATAAQRVHTMASALKVLSVCRLMMKDVQLFNPSELQTDMSPRVPSLIESCLANTIVSPESRFFSADWVAAAKLVAPEKKQYVSLEDLLPETELPESSGATTTTTAKGHLTPCPGWILQSLVNIACFIPNMCVKNTSLVNFDKDRFAYNCVVNVMDLVPEAHHSLDHQSPFGFLLDFRVPPVDLSAIYETAGTQAHQEIFGQHVSDQRKLMRLEADKKALLSKKKPRYVPHTTLHMQSQSTSGPARVMAAIPPGAGRRHNSASAASGESLPLHRSRSSVSVHSRETSGPNAPNSRLNAKSKFAGLLSRASKGLILKHGNGSPQDLERRPVPIEDIPEAAQFAKEHRPKVLGCLNLRSVSAYPTYVTPHSFKLDHNGDSGYEYCFQAASDTDRDDWVEQINFAHRHWFFSRSLNRPSLGAQANMVFGVPLDLVCARERSPIPNIIEKIMSEIEYRGLEEVGLYRKSASLAAIQKIKDKINRLGDFNMEDQLVFDVHNLTGCIKSYLRELPDPLIGDKYIGQFIKIKELAKDHARYQAYAEIFRQLPTYNYNLLERLARHLKLVVEYKDCNKMTSSNLATILGGSLIEGCNPENLRNYFGLMTFVCEDMIVNYEQVFAKAKDPAN